MKKFIALTVFALCAISVRTTSAGPEPLPADSKVVLPSEVTVEPVRPWFGVELSGGDGMGTDDGLLTLETFVPIWQNPNHHLFFGFGRAILSHDFDDEGRITNNVDLSSANSTCAECNPISTADVFRNPPINRDRDDVLTHFTTIATLDFIPLIRLVSASRLSAPASIFVPTATLSSAITTRVSARSCKRSSLSGRSNSIGSISARRH